RDRRSGFPRAGRLCASARQQRAVLSGLDRMSRRQLPIPRDCRRPASTAGFRPLKRRGRDLNPRPTEPPVTVFEPLPLWLNRAVRGPFATVGATVESLPASFPPPGKSPSDRLCPLAYGRLRPRRLSRRVSGVAAEIAAKLLLVSKLERLLAPPLD